MVNKNLDSRKNLPLIVAGCLFALVAITHLLRLYFGIEIMAANYVVPMMVSSVGAIVTGLLAIWMFVASRK